MSYTETRQFDVRVPDEIETQFPTRFVSFMVRDKASVREGETLLMVNKGKDGGFLPETAVAQVAGTFHKGTVSEGDTVQPNEILGYIIPNKSHL